MSKTTLVKQAVKDILSDGRVHDVADIKNYARKKCCEPITEGIFAGSIRTMTADGIIENVERGKYRLIVNDEQNGNTEQGEPGINMKILEATRKYQGEVIDIINGIEVKEENMEAIKTGIRLRKKIEKTCEELKKELQ